MHQPIFLRTFALHLCLLLWPTLAPAQSASEQSYQRARQVIEAGIQAFGGQTAIAAIKSFSLIERGEITSWSTPAIYAGQSGAELIANGGHFIRGYDPLTGKELWRFAQNKVEVKQQVPLQAHGLIYLTSGYPPGSRIYAFRPRARGNRKREADVHDDDDVRFAGHRRDRNAGLRFDDGEMAACHTLGSACWRINWVLAHCRVVDDGEL